MGQFVLLIFIPKIAEFFLNEQIPEAIIYIQFAMFTIWSVWLGGVWVGQIRLQSKIKRIDGESIQITDSKDSPFSLTEGRAKGAYKIIVKHLQAIKDAGERESQLDIPLLVKNTHDKLNFGSAFLRSVLSLFLILGLLGTLVGLAISLSSFSNALLGDGQLTSEILKDNLKSLLLKLGGAFLPSILGVFITILGVLIYSIFQRVTSIPLGNLIEQKTLTEWVPDIIKNPQEKERDNLVQLNNLIQDHVRLAKENEDTVNSFKAVAETFKTEAGDLATNVKSAGRTLKVLSESSQNLKEFSEKFVESVGHITSFQQELKNIYEQNAADSKIFRDTVESVLADNKVLQNAVAEQFTHQNVETQKLLEQLQIDEKAYQESRESIDQNLNKLLETAKETYEKIGSQSAETTEALVKGVVREVGDPLQGTLAKELGDISNNLDQKLGQINENVGEKLGLITGNIGDRLEQIGNKYAEITEHFDEFVLKLGGIKTGIDSIKNPIDDAAAEVKGIATGFEDRTTTMLNELERNFNTQIVTTTDQLNNLIGIKEGIKNLTGSLQGLSGKMDTFNSRAIELGNKLSNFRIRKPAVYQEKERDRDQTITRAEALWQWTKKQVRRNKK